MASVSESPSTSQRRRFDSLALLFLGPAHGTSLHRMRALERIGCCVTRADPWQWLPARRLVSKLLFETGAGFLDAVTAFKLERYLGVRRYPLVFVNGGELLGPSSLRILRRHAERVVSYNTDNAFTNYTKRKWRLHIRALPQYDLVVVTHAAAVPHARAAGAGAVMRVYSAADEIAHAPRDVSQAMRARYASEVAFVGTWMPERGPFIAELAARKVPLSIWGDRWHKAPEWSHLREYWRGPGIYADEEYRASIQASKICLGLVSQVTGDLHTTRSIEIPAIGRLLCARRTPEHLQMYDEGKEAVFWTTAAECADQCHALLANDRVRTDIAYAGHERCLRNGYFNEPMLASILHRVLDTNRDNAECNS
jgi:spore maturation protein CgeB